jgi:hypothetical protein
MREGGGGAFWRRRISAISGCAMMRDLVTFIGYFSFLFSRAAICPLKNRSVPLLLSLSCLTASNWIETNITNLEFFRQQAT